MRHRDELDDSGYHPSYDEGRGGRRYDAPRRQGQGRGPQRGGRKPGGGKRLSTGQKVAGWLSIGVVTVLVVAVLGLYLQYRSDWDSIKRVDVLQILGGSKQPPKLTNAENILLIGSDTRTAQHGVGGVQPGCNCSDTLMLLHISPGHHQVTVMSLPRDTVVPIQSCPSSPGFSGQTANPEEVQRINAALSTGGPACTWKIVEDETGIHIDHFIQLDFTGFENVINDLGGVQVCLPFAVNDPRSGLNLPSGPQTVNGTTALAFWREREAVGDGSDLERIQRDQFLMAALVQGMVHSKMLTSPTRILSIVKDATNSMTTDSGLDENAILQIAESLPGLSTKDVQFITAPNTPYPGDPAAEVEFAQPQAGQLFNAIQTDNEAPASSPSPAASQSSAPPAVAASQIKVEVENGSGATGVADQVAGDLTSQGFDVVGKGDANNFQYTRSVIEYAATSDQEAVNTLKAELPTAETLQNPDLQPGTLELIVGSTFTSLTGSTSTGPPAAAAGSGISNVVSSDKDQTLNASVNICQDSSVFNGPNHP